MLESDPCKPIGFFAFQMVVEDAKKLDQVRHKPSFGSQTHFPCLNLVYVAVDHRHQGRGIGRALMGRAIEDFAEIGGRTGLPLMILMPINQKVAAFYESLGFVRCRKGLEMYLPLRSAIEGGS